MDGLGNYFAIMVIACVFLYVFKTFDPYFSRWMPTWMLKYKNCRFHVLGHSVRQLFTRKETFAKDWINDTFSENIWFEVKHKKTSKVQDVHANVCTYLMHRIIVYIVHTVTTEELNFCIWIRGKIITKTISSNRTSSVRKL
jgi:hypothetical protein